MGRQGRARAQMPSCCRRRPLRATVEPSPPLSPARPSNPLKPPSKPPKTRHQVIDADYVNTAWERVLAADVKFRFSINVQKTLLMDA